MIMRQVFGAQMWFLGPKMAPRPQEWPELTKTRQNHPKTSLSTLAGIPTAVTLPVNHSAFTK